MIGMNEKVLIFTSREICYNSHFFFAHQVGGAFEKFGYEVEYCEFTKESDFDEESGQVDGTYAHAIERIFVVLVEAKKYEYVQVINKTIDR